MGLAVAILTWHAGSLPWVSIALTVSWGFYAFFRKTLPIGATQGFLLEVMLLSVPAVLVLAWLAISGQAHFMAGNATDTWLLAASGIVTAVPLILYGNGAKLASAAVDHRHHAIYRADDDLPHRHLHLQGTVRHGADGGLCNDLGGAGDLYRI